MTKQASHTDERASRPGSRQGGEHELALVKPAPTLRSTGAERPRTAVRHTFHLTDAGNAELFASLNAHKVRYDHRRGRWLVWEAHRWRPDRNGQVYRLAKDAMRRRFRDAASIEDLNTRSLAAGWAVKSENRNRLDALLKLAQSELPLADTGEDWDADPTLLCVSNGVIELKTGTLRDGRREDRLTMSADTAFQPAARCPRWEQFLAEVLDGDQALISFVHRAVGYSLTGATSEQCLFLCHGTGANGKSTFLEVLRHVLGDYGLNTPFSTLELQQRNGIPNDVDSPGEPPIRHRFGDERWCETERGSCQSPDGL
jgi:putative DNA primase/helicase